MRCSQPITTLPLFLSVALLTGQLLAADFTGRVVGVSDGDTITVLHKGKGERIRLHGIDCPEKRQAFGNRAKQFTSKLVFGNTVTVQVMDRDRYGRTVGVVLLPDGRSLNHELVRAGLAWTRLSTKAHLKLCEKSLVVSELLRKLMCILCETGRPSCVTAYRLIIVAPL